MKSAPAPAGADWRLLVISLPTTAATARMRCWRAIKALGGAALRDGVYLLPNRPELLQPLQAIADDAAAQDGKVWLLPVLAMPEEADYQALFDRSAEYAAWTDELAAARAAMASLGEAELLRLARRLGRGYDAIRRIDFFPGELASIAEAKWRDFNAAIDAVLSPGEPRGAARGIIARRDPAQYQGRRWATRRHLWVDRVACAWLIQRFIDPHATFLWLDDVGQCPADALGFDFDGATFTHFEDRVSFEVLLASFGLEEDKGLSKLAQLVHVLDVGGAPVAEASGFEAVLTGARQRLPDDDALLQEMSAVLESLYTHYAGAARRKR